MAVGCVNRVAALIGFLYKEMYGSFAGTKKVVDNNQVTVSAR